MQPRLLTFARDMRRDPTDAEKKLWHRLRDRRLSGFKFRRQAPFADFVLDFFCRERMLAVELDGGQHLDPEVAEYDRKREQALARMGVRILRFSDIDALKETDAVASRILDVLTTPSPDASSLSPFPPGEG